MNAEIISIGDELLIGQVVNTNASWLSQQLNYIGINVNKITTIADEEQSIINSFNSAKSGSDIILITGGLGPTNDDITKKVLCNYFNVSLELNEKAFRNLERLAAIRNRTLTEINKQQAMLPAGCMGLHNETGSAYGMWFEKENRIFISMPGVPHEMKLMVEKEVLPRLKERFSLPVILHKTILTEGVGESFLSEKIADWENDLPSYIKLAYLPSPGIVMLRLTAKGNDKNKIETEINKQLIDLEKLIGKYIFGYDKDTLEDLVGKLLLEKNQTIAFAESCTGGYISHLITSVPGSSAYFKGSVIAYAYEVKEKELNVSASDLKKVGAVSQAVAEQMATGVRNKYSTDYGVGVTGVAGPGGGTEEKPVGTVWIALSTAGGVVSKKYMFADNRERNIKKTALAALNMLRKAIIEE